MKNERPPNRAPPPGSPGSFPPRAPHTALHPASSPPPGSTPPAPTAPFAASYRALRLAAAVRPLDEAERRRAAIVAAVMPRWLDVGAPAADRLARRAALAERDRVLHDGLLLDMPPEALRTLVRAVDGPSSIPAAAGGALLLALHHGPLTSLGLWLGYLASRGDLPPLTILFDGRGAGSFGISVERFAALEAVGLLRAGAYRLLDVRGDEAAADVAARLRAGHIVLALPDARLLPVDDRRATRLRIGRRFVGVPRGMFRAAARAGVPLVPLAIHARGDGLAIAVGPPIAAASSRPADLAAAGERALGWLSAATLDPDPAAWALWPALAPLTPSA